MRVRYSYRSDDPESIRRLPRAAPLVLYAMAVVFLAVAVLLVFVGRQAAADARLLAAEGVPVQATVGARTVTETRSRDTNDRLRTTLSYRVELRFATATGEVVEVERAVSQAQFDSLTEGQAVQVFYVPSRPTLVAFDKNEDPGGAWIFWGIGAVFGLVGLGLALGGRGLRRRMNAA